ncbi:MAG: hypothetical protein Q8P62_03805 [Candidatus Peregrinibacteria bacterium]|nr:hypothetical protein [Candidatus Peregrinibacteria bacterium]
MNKNTYKKGILTFYFYPAIKDKTYVAACEELCLVREGKDPEYTKLSILADAKSYLINVCENKLGEHLLNQSLPNEIKKEFNDYRKIEKNVKFEKWTEHIKELLIPNLPQKLTKDCTRACQ